MYPISNTFLSSVSGTVLKTLQSHSRTDISCEQVKGLGMIGGYNGALA